MASKKETVETIETVETTSAEQASQVVQLQNVGACAIRYKGKITSMSRFLKCRKTRSTDSATKSSKAASSSTTIQNARANTSQR